MGQDTFLDLQDILPILVTLIVFILGNVAFRSRRQERTPVGIALSLLSDVSYNQRLLSAFRYDQRVKKFRTGSWKRNRDKLDFLGQKLQASLAETFGVAEEFNRNIDLAKKYRSSSYLAVINVEKLSKPIAGSRQGLEEWLKDNMGKKDYPGRRGLFR